MNFYHVLPDNRLLASTAPPYVRYCLENRGLESCILAAVEDGKLLSYAVFSRPVGASRDVWLEYIFTMEEYRETGAASALLKYSRDYMKKKGMINILCKVYSKFREAKDLMEFLVRRQFVPLTSDGKLLVYSYSSLMNSFLFEFFQKNKSKNLKTLKASELEERTLAAFRAREKETGFYFDLNGINDVFSRFIVKNGEIAAAVIAKKAGERDVYIPAPYLTKEINNMGLFPILLLEVVKDAGDIIGDDILVFLELCDEKMSYIMSQAFSPPEREMIVQEYMLFLGS